MENEKHKSYRLEPTIHKVNVFHLYSSYRFFCITCEECKFQHKCHDTKHKREICTVAKNTENLLMRFTHAQVSSFVAHEFYVLPQSKSQNELKEIFKFLKIKYMKKHAR